MCTGRRKDPFLSVAVICAQRFCPAVSSDETTVAAERPAVCNRCSPVTWKRDGVCPSPLPLAPAFPCHLSRLRVVPEPSRVCLSSARPPLSPAQPHFLSPHPFGPVPISLFLGSLSSWAAYRPPPRRRHTRVFDGLAVGAWVCVCSGPYVLRAHCTPHGPILSVRVCSVSPVLRCLLLLPVAVFLVPFQRSFFLGSRRG